MTPLLQWFEDSWRRSARGSALHADFIREQQQQEVDGAPRTRAKFVSHITSNASAQRAPDLPFMGARFTCIIL